MSADRLSGASPLRRKSFDVFGSVCALCYVISLRLARNPTAPKPATNMEKVPASGTADVDDCAKVSEMSSDEARTPVPVASNV